MTKDSTPQKVYYIEIFIKYDEKTHLSLTAVGYRWREPDQTTKRNNKVLQW
jgi:hypothetical protein